MLLKRRHLLHCSAPLRVLTCTACIFGSLNSFNHVVIFPRLWVSESVLIVPGLSLALQLPDSGSKEGGGRSVLHRGGFSS